MLRLTDEQWERIREHFPEENIPPDRPGRKPIPARRVLEGVLWILNTGAQWHMLPQRHPNYKTVRRRFQTWCCNEILRRVLTSSPSSSGKGRRDSKNRSLEGLAKLNPWELLRLARCVGRNRNNGYNLLDQSKFTKTLRPKMVNLSPKNRLLSVHTATKDEEQAIWTHEEISYETLIRSIRG